ncbi:MAG: metalloregulator ArsR/SmtB family transcription factor [Patescibacteria group bacterium]
MRELERLLKTLANQRRLAIIKYLKRKKEASVGEIAREIHLSLKATSKHLGLLSARDIVEKEQRSLSVYYRLVLKQEPLVKYILAYF